MALTRLQFALHMPTAIFIIEFCACLHITVSESSIHTLVFKKNKCYYELLLGGIILNILFIPDLKVLNSRSKLILFIRIYITEIIKLFITLYEQKKTKTCTQLTTIQ